MVVVPNENEALRKDGRVRLVVWMEDYSSTNVVVGRQGVWKEWGEEDGSK